MICSNSSTPEMSWFSLVTVSSGKITRIYKKAASTTTLGQVPGGKESNNQLSFLHCPEIVSAIQDGFAWFFS